MNTDTPETDKAHSDVIHGGSRFSFPEHARRMERERDAARRELAREREARKALYEAADVFAADQSRAPHPSCGLVQPVTVEDCERLNAALALAAKLP